MARPAHHQPALDPDQAAALHALRTVFGGEQVTVTDIQPASQADQDSAPNKAPAQATLLEEAS
jgi:hypothetical protein